MLAPSPFATSFRCPNPPAAAQSDGEDADGRMSSLCWYSWWRRQGGVGRMVQAWSPASHCRLCKPSDIQSPCVWIYNLRTVLSTNPGRGPRDTRVCGSTLHQDFSSCVHTEQHDPGANPTATSPRGTGAAVVLVEKHQHDFMVHPMLWRYGTWLFPAFANLFPICFPLAHK